MLLPDRSVTCLVKTAVTAQQKWGSLSLPVISRLVDNSLLIS